MLGNGIGQFLELTNLRAIGFIQIGRRTCPCHQGISNAYELQIILGIDRIRLMFDKGSNGQKIGQEPRDTWADKITPAPPSTRESSSTAMA